MAKKCFDFNFDEDLLDADLAFSQTLVKEAFPLALVAKLSVENKNIYSDLFVETDRKHIQGLLAVLNEEDI